MKQGTCKSWWHTITSLTLSLVSQWVSKGVGAGSSPARFFSGQWQRSGGQGQLHKVFQAPSGIRSANIQPVKASHMAEPKVRKQRNTLALLWKELQGFRAKDIFSDRELRATINYAVSAQSLFAMSYSYVPNFPKEGAQRGALCNGWVLCPEQRITEEKEGIGRDLVHELEALHLFTALGAQPYWTLASSDANLKPTLTLTLRYCWSPSSLWNWRMSLSRCFYPPPSPTQAVPSQSSLKVFLWPPAPENTGVLQNAVLDFISLSTPWMSFRALINPKKVI